MSDVVYSAPEALDFAARFRPFIARLADALDRAFAPGGIERELDALPDFLLRDIGVARCDIPEAISPDVASLMRDA